MKKQILTMACLVVAFTQVQAGEEKAGSRSPGHVVVIDALFVDFPTEEIAALSRNGSPLRPDSVGIMQLWKDGAGTLLHAVKLSTRSGVNAQYESVREHIYATEFKAAPPDEAGEGTSSACCQLVPSHFETREAGVIFNCTPMVSPDGATIDLTLVAELCTDPEWAESSIRIAGEKGDPLEFSVPLPIFHSRNTTTALILKDQSTCVLGGSENPEGDGMTYLFITATVVGGESNE